MRSFALSVATLSLLIGACQCGGEPPVDGPDAGNPAGTVTVSGTVTGLKGTGLVLRNNGADELAISADGPFTFSQKVQTGSAFNVTVATQPTSPLQTCSVSGGQGTAGTTNITGVVVNCATDTFTVGGVITGLEGSVVLQNNGGADLVVNASGSFAFATPVPSGSPYLVTVLTQPSSPSQTCVVSDGSGTVADMNVTSVRIECVTNSFTVGGVVDGLAGGGLVLQLGAQMLPVSADGVFTFNEPLQSGATYAVSVAAHPTAPTQTCVVTNGAGTVTSAPITHVEVTCATNSYTIGGTVSGLLGSGLVLRNSGGDDLVVTADGAFTFATPVESGATFDVTVAAQPSLPTQTCTVTGGTGTVAAGAVTSVTVNCSTNSYSVGGTVTGLVGAGLLLRNNGGDDLFVNANGTFAFPSPVLSGTPYAVTVDAQPTSPWQTCTVANGTGSVGGSDVTHIQVTCTTDSYTVGGTVSGLGGSGLVLRNNGADPISVSANGSFTFPTAVASGSTYAVTVDAQPTSPWQSCVVTNASGTIAGGPITHVAVTCTTNTYSVGGTVSGLAGTGLVLRNNGGDDLPVNANGTFAFATEVFSGAPYAITVHLQPTSPWQTCTIMNGSGNVTNAPVTNVSVSCTTNKYTVGGTVTGLQGNAVVLQNNLGDNLGVTQNGSFTFPTTVASGAPYSVTVLAHPAGPSQTCNVVGGSGIVGSGPVTSVVVDCQTNAYTVGGTVSGLSGTLVLRNNNQNSLTLTSNGSFAFSNPQASGTTYSVTVFSQPSGQSCTVANGTGTVGSGNVTSVSVTCVNVVYTVGGTLSGLGSGKSIVLRNNNTNDLTLTANGTFSFSTPLPSGTTYSVTVFASPSGQSCTVTNGTGTIGNANVTNVAVQCTNLSSVTLSYTGGVQTFTVPQGITLIHVQAWGAQGGAGDMPGGLGGTASASIPVTPGEVLNVYVGGAGGTLSSGTSLAGGFNGGGSVHTCCGTGVSGTGGGASDVRRGTSLSNRLIVAGGGGGGAWSNYSASGGGGGGLVGLNGTSTGGTTRPPGMGGTQSAGGASGWVGTNYPNQPGSFGVGGDTWRDGAGSGGGGGGWYGGGGGGFTGGGGGSSYVDAPGNTAKSTTAAVRSGHGQVSITW